MNHTERLNLQKMISDNDVKDYTQEIREKKHSRLLRQDINTMIELKGKFGRLKPQQLDSILMSKCGFLYNNYTDIFNKLKNNELDVPILLKFVSILESIENGKHDQHSGSYEVGKMLKTLYLDSALKQKNMQDLSDKKKRRKQRKQKKPTNTNANLTWAEYKKLFM